MDMTRMSMTELNGLKRWPGEPFYLSFFHTDGDHVL